MKKKLFLALIALSLPTADLYAQNNIGSCGWGSKLFEGKQGIIPQVLAVTTNGTSGNQTFAITSGTSGCTQDGVVSSSWKTAAFIDSNMNKLALDVARGEGESLASLRSVIGVAESDAERFNVALKTNFATLFPNDSVSSGAVVNSLRDLIAADSILAKYAASV